MDERINLNKPESYGTRTVQGVAGYLPPTAFVSIFIAVAVLGYAIWTLYRLYSLLDLAILSVVGGILVTAVIFIVERARGKNQSSER